MVRATKLILLAARSRSLVVRYTLLMKKIDIFKNIKNIIEENQRLVSNTNF